LGIGTNAPGSVLQVFGGAAIGFSSSTSAPSLGLIVSGNTIFGSQITSIGAKFQYKQSEATIAIQSTSGGGFSGFNIYNESDTLAFSFQYGNGSTGIYAGNLLFGSRTSTGKILFVQGGGANPIGTWFSTGNLLIGTGTSDAGYRFDVSGSTRVSGNTQITGSLTVTQGITGSLQGTSSWAQNAVTSSYILQAVSASFATSSSYASNGGVTQIIAGTNITISPTSGTGSITINAAAGAAFPFTGSAIITGSLIVTGSTTSTLGFTGSLFGTASFSTTSSFTLNIDGGFY
jgi:hypothetical protein